MLHELRRQRDIISLEAVSGEGALGTAASRLPSFFTSAKSFFSKHLGEPITDFFAKKDLTFFARKIQKTPYADLRPIQVSVPAGLKVDYLTYITTLLNSTTAIRSLKFDILVPYAAWLSNKLGNPSSLASNSNTLNIQGYKPHDIEELEKLINDCFVAPQAVQTATMAYGTALKRNTDWTLIAEQMALLEQEFDEKGHKEIVKFVDHTSELLHKLIARIEEDKKKEEYKLSPTTMKAMSETTYAIACEIEFYGLLRHRVKELNVSLKAAAAKVTDLLKEDENA